MGNILSKITDVLGGNLLKGATDLIDQVTTTKEEKELLKIKMQELLNTHAENVVKAANQELETITKDIQNARDRDIQANNSATSSWLSKNITPIIAISSLILAFGLYFYAFRATIEPNNKDIALFVLGAIGPITGQVISYYFGSTKTQSNLLK